LSTTLKIKIMPASTYYLDSTDLATASYIYSDSSMTAPAATGYYSDGVICRYWHLYALPDLWILDPATYCNN
jgi:hypothetical protein